MTGEHFAIRVRPDALRNVAERLDDAREVLSRRGPLSEATPGEIGEQWTGATADASKAEMVALGRELTRYVRMHHEAADALRRLARRYDDALDRLPGLNRRWRDARDERDATWTLIADDERKQGGAVLLAVDKPETRRVAADALLDEQSAILQHRYEEVVAEMRRDTMDAATDLALAMAVLPSPDRVVDDVEEHDSLGGWYQAVRQQIGPVLQSTATAVSALPGAGLPVTGRRVAADVMLTAEVVERVRSRFLTTSRELEAVDLSLKGMGRDLEEACGPVSDAIVVAGYDFRGSWRSVYRYCAEVSSLIARTVDRMSVGLDHLDGVSAIEL